MRINPDKLGKTASTMCAIHCIVTPIVITMIPFTQVAIFTEGLFEKILLCLSMGFGLVAMCWGVKKHKKHTPAFFISLGLLFLLIGHVTHRENFSILHTLIMLTAGIMLIAGHTINHKLCHSVCPMCKE